MRRKFEAQLQDAARSQQLHYLSQGKAMQGPLRDTDGRRRRPAPFRFIGRVTGA